MATTLKEFEIRANFITNKDEWNMFKMLANHKQMIENGVFRPVTASDLLRQYVKEYIKTHSNLVAEIKQKLQIASS